MSQVKSMFEAPGPKGKKINLVISMMAMLLIIVGSFYLYVRFDQAGQFDARKWEIFTYQGTILFLLKGLCATLLAAAISTVFAFLFSIPLALAKLSSICWLQRMASWYIDFFRAIPLLLLILFLVVLLPSLGLNWSSLAFLVLGLTLHHSALFAEVVRTGIVSLNRGQSEAACALGMMPNQVTFYIVLPQALKMMLPALMNNVLALVQDTSLGYIIPYEELLKSSQQISSFAPESLLQSAFIVTVMYGLISALVLGAKRVLERRV